jgi:HK97 family phage major capsid protein
LLDALAEIEGVNGSPHAYLVNAARKRALAGLKATGTGEYLPAPPDVAELTRLVTNKLSGTQAAMGDFSQMLVGIRRDLRIEITRVAGDAYKDDQVWIKATWRGDVQFARPDHFVKIEG